MANTYTSICIHLIFAVKNRESLISPLWQSQVHAYLGGILAARGHKPIIIGGVNDHVHLLFKYNLNDRIPDLVRELKVSSGKFISEGGFSRFRFNWQTGYACFSCDPRNLDGLIRYISTQPEHHKGRSLRDEMILILRRMGVEFDERYLFGEID